jgi:formylglycine-generating enzyme required for sulfatase activity
MNCVMLLNFLVKNSNTFFCIFIYLITFGELIVGVLSAYDDSRLIPASFYKSGSNLYNDDERPVHSLYLSSFYCDVFEVSTTLWAQVVDWAEKNGYEFDEHWEKAKIGPSWSPAPKDHPMNMVTWHDSIKWCNARSEMEGLPPVYFEDLDWTIIHRKGTKTLSNVNVNWLAPGYRLPTEAEWEKAARGGRDGNKYSWGNVLDGSKANYRLSGDMFDNASTPVGYFNGAQVIQNQTNSFAGHLELPLDMANDFGLYDMTGNVSEWCWDWYDPYWYGNPLASDPDSRGPASIPTHDIVGGTRVLRGGSFQDYFSKDSGYSLRIAFRYQKMPQSAQRHVGLRCVRTATPLYSWIYAKDYGNDWKRLDWFGCFFEHKSGWIYHSRWKWLYRSTDGSDSTWLWHPKLGWFWTNLTIYPYFWIQDAGGWFFLNKDSSDDLLIYSVDEQVWSSVSD